MVHQDRSPSGGQPGHRQGQLLGSTTDQRGVERPQDDPAIQNAPGGDGSDIGAFELQVPAIVVTPTSSGLSTTEAGDTAAFTIVLNTKPTDDVTIPLSSSDTTEGTVSPSSVVFTPTNFSTPQTVTVTGVDDEVDDGDVEYKAISGPATSTDSDYSDLDADDVSLTNGDDEDAPVAKTTPTPWRRATGAS